MADNAMICLSCCNPVKAKRGRCPHCGGTVIRLPWRWRR